MVRTAEEYNLRTLFAPRLAGRPLLDQVGILMTHPATWLVESALAGLLVVFSILVCLGQRGLEAFLLVAAAGGVAILFPVAYVAALWLLDVFEREPKRVIVSLFLWGASSSFFSFIANTILGILGAVTVGEQAAELLTAVFGAPVVEEFFKGAGLVLLAGHHEMEDTYDGMLYGFAVGMGFAAVENFLYFTVNVTPGVDDVTPGYWLLFMLYRSVICALGHGSFTATTGAVMGFLKNRASSRRWAQAIAPVSAALAMVMHGTFNLSATFQSVVSFRLFHEPLVPLFHGPLIILFAGFWLLLVAPLALWETKKRMERDSRRER